MADITSEIEQRLFELEDKEYRLFQCKLMPNVKMDTVIGVRTPLLRRLASEFSKRPDISDFLNALPHKYYDENNLHCFIIEKIKDYDEVLKRVDEFLPYVNNWATCDLMSPKVFAKHTDELYEEIRSWIGTGRTFTVRFGIEMLMSFYLDERFKPEYAELVASVRSQEYYVNMMIAWYFATALAKQYDTAIKFIEQQKLDTWTHNKTIQKAIESYRITDEQKAYLRSLKK